MVISDLDVSWPLLLAEIDAALPRHASDARTERVAEAAWRLSWSAPGECEIYIEANDHAPSDPFDAPIPEPVLIVTKVIRELSRSEGLTDEAARAALVAAGDSLYLRPCTRLHPDGSRKPVLAMTHTLYLETLNVAELVAVLGEARAGSLIAAAT